MSLDGITGVMKDGTCPQIRLAHAKGLLDLEKLMVGIDNLLRINVKIGDVSFDFGD
jgi:hypothetical protein